MSLGCDFGFQADIGVIDELDRATYGGAAHLFTRDPDSCLFGVTGGYFDAGDTDIWAVGPEAELPMSIPRKPRLEPFRFDRSFRFDRNG